MIDLDVITATLEQCGLDNDTAYNLACLADSLSLSIENNHNLAMDHTKPSKLVYTTIKGKTETLHLGPTYPYQ